MPKTKTSTSSKTNTVKPVLYDYWRSSASWRIRWTLNIKGIEYESKKINLLNGEQKSPDYLKINPAGQIPTLVIDGVAYGESLAIMEYLEETHPQNPILPTDPTSRLCVRQLSLSIVAGIHPLQNMRPQQFHSDDPEKRKAFAKYFIELGLTSYEARIRNTSGSFSFGGQVTMADICLIPQTYNALRYGVDITKFPIIKSIYERCLNLPECAKAAPENQSDAIK